MSQLVTENYMYLCFFFFYLSKRTTHDAPPAPDVATISSGATDVCSSSAGLIIHPSHPLCVVRARVC